MTNAMTQAIASVQRGEAHRIAAPGRYKVWRDDAGFHVDVPSRISLLLARLP